MEEKKLLNEFTKSIGELKNPIKNAINPHFKNRYSTLDVVCDEIREKFYKNGIAIIQIPQEIDGKMILKTQIIGYGETIDFGNYPITAEKNTPQAIGSALTYARRYSLCAICGIASEEDDDGNAGTGENKEKEEKPQAPIMSPFNPKVKAETMKQLLVFARKHTGNKELQAKDLIGFFKLFVEKDLKTCTESEIIEAMK